LPFCDSSLCSSRPKPPAYPQAINTSGDYLRKRRLNPKLLQKQVAELIGVNAITVCNRESNRTVPLLRSVPGIIRLLGYGPFPPAENLPEQLIIAHKVLGLSRKKLAEKLGIDESTLRNCEAHRRQPTRKSLATIQSFLTEL